MLKLRNITSRYRYSVILARQFAVSDFKLRYQGSILGYLWSLLRPLALFAVLYIVFVRFLPVGDAIPHFPIYLLLGIVVWNFFNEITSGSVAAIASKGDLIRKISFPKYVIILAGSISALINLGFNVIIVILFMLLFGTDVAWTQFWGVPLLIFQVYILGLGFAFWLSALYVRYRDVAYVWEVVVQAGFYATPILYPLNAIPDTAQKLIILNPVAMPLQELREILVTPVGLTIGEVHSSLALTVLPLIFAVVLLVSGGLFFRARSKSFAEEV